MHEIHRANHAKRSVVLIEVFPSHSAYLTCSHACKDLGVEEIVSSVQIIRTREQPQILVVKVIAIILSQTNMLGNSIIK